MEILIITIISTNWSVGVDNSERRIYHLKKKKNNICLNI